MTVRLAPERDARLHGHRAGVITRFAAFVVDVVTVALLFALAAQVVDYVVSVLLRHRLRAQGLVDPVRRAPSLWAFAYFAYPLAVSGRTFGMMVLGLKVVRSDGHEISTRRAGVRVLVLAGQLGAVLAHGAHGPRHA